MNGLVGWDSGTQLELVEPPQPAPPVSSLEEAISKALANSPEVREAQETIKKARAGRKIHKLSYWPNVNVMGGWIYQNEVLEIITEKNFGFAGVTVSLFEFEWGKKRRLNEQASLQVQLAERNLTVTEGKVALEAQKAYWTFERAREAHQSKRDIVRLRQQAQQGTSSSTVTAALDQAKLDEMKAKLQYALAHELLKKAISRTEEGRTRNARVNDWTPVRPLREFTPGQTPVGTPASGALVGRNRLFPIDPLK
jgi:outer membrane protein TolC